MATNKKRLAQLEKKREPNKPTWKDFVTGAWKPSPQEWQAFLLQSEISFQVQDESGGATVHFFDGHKEQVKEPLASVKTYRGIDPSKWEGDE
jgi:hypothetical protein